MIKEEIILMKSYIRTKDMKRQKDEVVIKVINPIYVTETISENMF